MKRYYIYSINPDDEVVEDIIKNNGIVNWEIPFTGDKGKIGDIIYIYVTGRNKHKFNYLSYDKRIAYVAEIIGITDNSSALQKRLFKVKIEEIKFSNSEKLFLTSLREKYNKFHPPQSHPIDLQEERYYDFKIYIQNVCSAKDYLKEEMILNDFFKYNYFYITKPNLDSNLRSWSKLHGVITSKILKTYIKRELDKDGKFDVSEENSFIAGYPTEFDLLIILKGSQPLKYSNIYKPEDVNTIIEIKTAGVIGKTDDINAYFKSLKLEFERIWKKHKLIKFVYITIQERASTKRATSINYFKLTEDQFHPYKAFCLYDNYNRKIRANEWGKFINEILQ
ncbi:MAG: hypothetical protein NT175_01825 [Bacteroidetes bacterium]|nr:hypothetical protein [Bacteroidota bacterium]